MKNTSGWQKKTSGTHERVKRRKKKLFILNCFNGSFTRDSVTETMAIIQKNPMDKYIRVSHSHIMAAHYDVDIVWQNKFSVVTKDRIVELQL